jgi:hypothetical protein
VQEQQRHLLGKGAQSGLFHDRVMFVPGARDDARVLPLVAQQLQAYRLDVHLLPKFEFRCVLLLLRRVFR